MLFNPDQNKNKLKNIGRQCHTPLCNQTGHNISGRQKIQKNIVDLMMHHFPASLAHP